MAYKNFKELSNEKPSGICDSLNSLAPSLRKLLRDAVLGGFQETPFTDVHLEIMDKEYHVHSFILSSSQYFRKMLSGPWKENKAKSLKLDLCHLRISERTSTTVISYLYGFAPVFSSENCKEILALAAFFDLHDLCQLCVRYVCSTMSPSTATTWIRGISHLDYGKYGAEILERSYGCLYALGFCYKHLLLELDPITASNIVISDEFWAPSEFERFLLIQELFSVESNSGSREPKNKTTIRTELLENTAFVHMLFEELSHVKESLPVYAEKGLWMQMALKSKVLIANKKSSIHTHSNGAAGVESGSLLSSDADNSSPSISPTVFPVRVLSCSPSPPQSPPSTSPSRSPRILPLAQQHGESVRLQSSRNKSSPLHGRSARRKPRSHSYGSDVDKQLSLSEREREQNVSPRNQRPKKSSRSSIVSTVSKVQQREEGTSIPTSSSFHASSPSTGFKLGTFYDSPAGEENNSEDNDPEEPHRLSELRHMKEASPLMQSFSGRLSPALALPGRATSPISSTMLSALRNSPTLIHSSSSSSSSSSSTGIIIHSSEGKDDGQQLISTTSSASFISALSKSALFGNDNIHPSLARSSSWKERQTGLEKFPPFRFGVEFRKVEPFTSLLRSPAVYYAGSLWRVYLTKWENRQRMTTVNVILVREKTKPDRQLTSASYFLDMRPKVYIHFKCIFYPKNQVCKYSSEEEGVESSSGLLYKLHIIPFESLSDYISSDGNLRMSVSLQLL